MAIQQNQAPTDTDSPLNARISSIGRRLSDTLGQFVESVPGKPRTPQQLAVTLGVNKDLSHRVVTALRGRDALAAAYLMPGPEPLRRLVKAGLAKGVPATLAKEAEAAISDFDELIRSEAGDRSGLDAMISAWLPDARHKFETTAKQWMYRGSRQITGVAADLTLFTTILHAVPDCDRLDAVNIRGYWGLRCIRPGATMKLGVRSGASNLDAIPMTLEDKPATGLKGILLEEFCDGTPVELGAIEKGDTIIYTVEWGDSVGLKSARDIVLAELRRRAPRKHRTAYDPTTKTGLMNEMSVPSKMCICDIILGEDVYPNWDPQVRVLRTGEAGWANPNDETRDVDVLDVIERIEPLGTGVDRFRATEIPNYVELLSHICQQLGWREDLFRGYRTKIEYPIFSSQVQFAFDLPPDPATA